MSGDPVLLHNGGSMPSRLLPALTLSLALHLGLLLPDALRLARPVAAPRLEASLRLPEKAPPASDEALLKNTLTTRPAPPTVKPPPAARIASPAPSPSPSPSPAPAPNRIAARREIAAAQRKLSQHLYYPPAAVARGIEGEVRLILRLSADGSIAEVDIATGSGHAILDQAAVKAAYAMGHVSWAHSRELILPVIFRLE
jgi:protein TonB